MIRNLKALGLAMVAVFAMSALSATAAQAAPEIKAAEYPATLSGSQTGTHVFTASGRKVTCKVANFAGTLAAQSSSVKVTPTYQECHSEILGTVFPATVTMNGCYYLFTATTQIEKHKATAHVDIVCEAGKEIFVHVYENEARHKEDKSMCTITIPAQTKRQHAIIDTETALPETLNVTATVENIKYTVSPQGLLCGSSGEAATYVGNTKVIGKNGGGTQISITEA